MWKWYECLTADTNWLCDFRMSDIDRGPAAIDLNTLDSESRGNPPGNLNTSALTGSLSWHGALLRPFKPIEEMLSDTMLA
jgi:hypothetical protein